MLRSSPAPEQGTEVIEHNGMIVAVEGALDRLCLLRVALHVAGHRSKQGLCDARRCGLRLLRGSAYPLRELIDGLWIELASKDFEGTHRV